MTDKIIQEAQKFNPDAVITLLHVDLRPLGGTILYLSPIALTGAGFSRTPVQWRGNVYTPIPLEITGFEINSSGQFPRPKLKVSNILGQLNSYMIEFDNLAGAEVTRIRVFRKHLDDGSDPDPDVMFPPDVYRIDRKSNDDLAMLEFELASVIDQEGVRLPRRQVIRNTCTHVYRIWDAAEEAFDYDKATCPFTGIAMFDERGEAVTAGAEDKCSKLIKTGCDKRFPGQPLPTRAYPGVGKTR